VKRSEERVMRASVSDGRGTANVWVEDGSGRVVSAVYSVVGVHSVDEAIRAARREGFCSAE
jgi:hypothetical protein